MSNGPAVVLRTLGAIGLEGPDPVACERIVAQSKQVALLACLAARPAGEAVSRDRLLAMFWPESSAGRARGSLRTALHRLRHALGRKVIVNRGHAIEVSAAHMRCDAARVLDRESAETAESLLDLYRGEFLDGLHVFGVPDFEHWVDRTRAALRARAVELAWALSKRAETSGEWITAARFARRAADLAVDVEGATQRLIRLLDRVGDRAAAIAAYDRLVTFLEREYDLAPSPETSSLVATIRARGGDAAPDGVPGRVSSAQQRAQSLAVLPFEDSGDEEASWLARGISEDLLTALSGIHRVRVISRASVRRFVDRPPQSMGEVRDLLGVELVVEGSVRVRGDRCRITVQLIDARRDTHLWAQTYDRELTDVFAVQSDVALRVARALEVELSPREHRRLRRPPTTSIRAWQLYLKGREAWNRRDAKEAARATSLFRQALELDDGFAQAWVGLADAHLTALTHAGASLSGASGAARDAIEKALERDPDSGEARATLGLIRTFFEPDPSAEAEFRRAVELSPGYAPGHQWLGNWLCSWGRTEAGIAELRLAVDLDPLSPVVGDSLALGLLHAGMIPDAEAQFHATLELDDGFWRAQYGLAVCAAIRGDLRVAAGRLVEVCRAGGWGTDAVHSADAERALETDPRAALEHLLQGVQSSRQSGTGRMVEVTLLTLLDRPEEAVAAIEAGSGQPWLAFLIVYSPVLDPLAGEERFRDAMESAGLLLPRWRNAG